ncbi:MAG: zf-HC2 domain-containing protein [Caldilineales bacterium]|nr:zf-HC2 domain-containing protein [Caldilineales bacterium]
MSAQHATHNCSEVLTQLNDYVDGELDAGLCVELEDHLRSCTDCRIVLDTLQKTVYLVHQLGDQDSDIPEDVEARLFAKMNLETYLPARGA